MTGKHKNKMEASLIIQFFEFLLFSFFLLGGRVRTYFSSISSMPALQENVEELALV